MGARMIKISAVRPQERCQAVNRWRKELAYEEQPKVQAWGLEVSYRLPSTAKAHFFQVNREMVQLRARVLDPPRIMYAGNQDARAYEGA